MNTQKGFVNILIIILGLLVVGGGSYVYLNQDDLDTNNQLWQNEYTEEDIQNNSNQKTENGTNTNLIGDVQDNDMSWAEYRQNKFTFKYPDSWDISDIEDGKKCPILEIGYQGFDVNQQERIISDDTKEYKIELWNLKDQEGDRDFSLLLLNTDATGEDFFNETCQFSFSDERKDSEIVQKIFESVEVIKNNNHKDINSEKNDGLPFITKINNGEPLEVGEEIMVEGGNFSDYFFRFELSPVSSSNDFLSGRYYDVKYISDTSFSFVLPEIVNKELHGDEYRFLIKNREYNYGDDFVFIYPEIVKILPKKNTINKKELGYYDGFWFAENNPAIISDLTRYIADNKNNVETASLKEFNDGIEIINKTEDDVLIEIPTGGCLGTNPPELYVYASENSDKIFGMNLSYFGGEDLQNKIDNIDIYVNEISLQPERDQVVIKDVSNPIDDGHYYAVLKSVDETSSNLTLDFLSLSGSSDHSGNLDVLLGGYIDNTQGPTASVSTTNNNVVYRTYPYSNNKNFMEKLLTILDIHGPANRNYLSKVLVKIENGVVIEINMLNAFC